MNYLISVDESKGSYVLAGWAEDRVADDVDMFPTLFNG